MPELPEVETVRRGIASTLEGRVIRAAWAMRPDLRWPLPERFAERLTGRRVLGLRRRSKYILVDLDGGLTWLIHLGMSGRIAALDPDAGRRIVGRFVHAAGAAPGPEGDALASADGGPALGPHDHVVVRTDAGMLIYTDPRRFGAMDLFPTDDEGAHKLLGRLGPEPFDAAFDGGALAAALAGKTAPIKAALLDQQIVAGLGNIYVCESLWRAGVDPRRAAGGISRSRLKRLAEAVRAVLAEAIEAGGSSLRDHRQADGALGYFQHSFAVYGREGAPCLREGCGGVVQRLAQSGRSSFFCPRCQR